ncbi:MAG TPA: papain-like cysteine protease family protein [Capillimicrobium sp.]|nr:papain-like cysteine protease family protein [Capillimicrobium sp.]
MNVTGKVTGPADVAGYRVTAGFEAAVADAPEGTTAIARRIADVAPSGDFALELPDAAERVGPTTFAVASPAGLEVARVVKTEEELAKPVEIAVDAAPQPVSVPPSADPGLGRAVTYAGRVIDPAGTGAPAGLLVVLWGIPPGGADDDATPLDVASTSAGGYVYGPWPDEELTRAFAVVAGGEPVEIALEERRLPARFAIVLDELPAAPQAAGDDCACEAPPRAPDQAQLAENGEAFAADVSRCADFSVPNRTLEEVTYQAVVRTTQPELRGTPAPRRPQVPQTVVAKLLELARGAGSIRSGDDDGRPALRRGTMEAEHRIERRTPIRLAPEVVSEIVGDDTLAETATTRARMLLGGIDLDRDLPADDGVTPHDVAAAVIERRDAARAPLQLEPSVLAELAREQRPLTPLRLVDAELSSAVRRFRGAVDQIAAPNPARFELGDAHQVDWDELPLPYQATTIAHGHLLTLKQVWKADGYSLGDLLYSLPLAPGQQKLVSVLDWDRRETARRDARRTETEQLGASIAHDRDISDVVSSTLRERLDGSSFADVGAAGGGLGAFIGPLIIGGAGGVATASSTARQSSGRDVSGSALNQVRDRTMQAASAVRGQRATVVQTARQGESVSATTEVLANYNHCHAMTVEYFEVLRHLQVSQELHEVQECLFVPMAITPFSQSKALRWRDVLEPSLRRPALRGAFASLERVATSWADADMPDGRYADEPVVHLEGDLGLRMRIPRPQDAGDGGFDESQWVGYEPWLGGITPREAFERYLGIAPPNRRDAIWDRNLAPGIAQRLVNALTLELLRAGAAGPHRLVIDPTLVSSFAQDRTLTIGLRVDAASIAGVTRAAISGVRLGAPANAPGQVTMTVDTASFRYRTDHLAHDLVAGRRVSNDLSATDAAELLAPLDALERRNPRERDRRLADELLEHLDEHLEHYHRAIWLRMDPNRRYLLLDGFIAPDAGGRSVASVVENRIAGIVGNSLVMPLRPGAKLDPTYEFADATAEDLRHLYAGDPAPPMRISLPTRGVFAEAVLGHCNSCEVIDDSRSWRFEEAPIPDAPTAIQPLSTGSRRRPEPSLTPDVFPEPLVRLQQAPAAPDPTGLAAAMTTLGTAGVFRDITGLALNQANSAAALKTAIGTAQTFATQAGALAQQRFMAREIDRSVARIKDARDQGLIKPEQAQRLTESAMRAALGQKRPKTESATSSAGVSAVIDRATSASKGGSLRITRPEGTVEVKTGAQASTPKVDAAVDPEVAPIKQQSSLVCWAAAGTMMRNWKERSSTTVEATLDALGGPWRAHYDANKGVTATQLRDFAAALGLTEEGAASYTVEGLAALLSSEGPLWAITDDDFGDGNHLLHARIVTAVRGDGTADGTTVVLADSASGKVESEPFTEFARRLEATEAVRFGTGVFHW